MRVTATNTAGDGAASSEETGTPAAAALSAHLVTATTATLSITIHTGNWYYQYTTPTGGSCSSAAVSGTSTSLTGLATGTSYTFKQPIATAVATAS